MSETEDKKLEQLLQSTKSEAFEPFFVDRVMNRLAKQETDNMDLFLAMCIKFFVRFATPAIAVCLLVMAYNIQTGAASDMGAPDNFVEALFSIPPENSVNIENL